MRVRAVANLMGLIEEMRRRYEEREGELRLYEACKREGRLPDADAPERVPKRLSHLGIDRATAETVIEASTPLGPADAARRAPGVRPSSPTMTPRSA